MARGYKAGLAERVCRFPDCGGSFPPIQERQRYCSPARRHDANRLKRAIPVAQRYLQRVLDQLGDDPVVPS